MGRFLPCPMPCNCDKHRYSQIYQTSHISDSSSSNSSLTSQLSLPSVPSLEHVAAANHQCLVTLKGHSSYIFSLSLAGKYLFSGPSNGEIRASASHGGTSMYVAAQTGSAVKSITFINGKLITAHADRKIHVWRIKDHVITIAKLKLTTTLPTGVDRCIRLFSAGSYVEVRRHRRQTWVHHVDAVAALAASADGAFLYSVSWDRSMKVWRSTDFRCVESVQAAHDDAINAVAASVDGSVYTGSADRLIKVWRRRNDGESRHSVVATLEKHKSAVNALALSTEGSVLYSGACDRSIVVWEKGRGGGMAVAGALRGHRKAILCLAVVAEVLCSGSADKSVRVWRRGSGNSYSCLAVLEGHKCPVKCLVARLDGRCSEVDKKSEGMS
ncbi:protein JINGUBANG-like [Salvia splendens]|uniref:protein JINGUBANG-like n=1 Tax=Salvia splendens TaxID=180675 RepID=UPI001C26986E|nr:protein JINGUBANG-like [Salvia splendens]